SPPRHAPDSRPHPRLEILIHPLPPGRIHSGLHPAASVHAPPGDVGGGARSAGEQSIRPHPCRAPRATSVLTRALKIVVAGCAFLFLLLALVQEPDEVLRPRERFPTLREEVLDQDLAVRLLVDGDAPFVEGARDFDLEVLLRGLIPNNFVVFEPSSS